MPWDTFARRPDWWEPWIPARCPEAGCGQPFVPGNVSLSWEHCECPGAGEAHGHQTLRCGRVGCHWWMWPPEHVGGEQEPERPRSYGSPQT